jgi:hypothetical protein
MTSPTDPRASEGLTPEAAAVLADAAAIINETATHSTRLTYRRRRLLRSLFDLGLLDIVGPDWVVVGDTGFDFAELSDRASDQLTCALEDIARRYEAHRPRPQPIPGQLSFGF